MSMKLLLTGATGAGKPFVDHCSELRCKYMHRYTFEYDIAILMILVVILCTCRPNYKECYDDEPFLFSLISSSILAFLKSSSSP